jgi:Arm domain-containing DNA-binding protein
MTNDQSQHDLGMQDAGTQDEAVASGAQPADSDDLVEAEPCPDLIWDDEAPGLCVRVYGNGSKSFIFVYRFKDQQRFTRIGRTPEWSLQAARVRAKELRSMIDQGRDPAGEKHEPKDPTPVAELMQFLAEHPPTTP